MADGISDTVAQSPGRALASSPKVEINVSSLPKGPSNRATPLTPKPAPVAKAAPSVTVDEAAKARPKVNKIGEESGLFKRLEEKIKPGSGNTPLPREDDPRPGAIAEVDEAPDEAAPAEAPEAAPEAADAPAVADDKKKAKPSPWKLYEEKKQEVAKLITELEETRKRAIPEEKWREETEKRSTIEKRAAELEEEIKFVNYAKSAEYKEKYEKPYFDSWKRAEYELKGVMVEQDGAAPRAMNNEDMLELVNLPLGEAKLRAVDKFGELAPEVMQFRNEIRKSSDAQQNALDEARKTGVARDKENTEKQQRLHGEVTKSIGETWNKANEEVLADPKHGMYFKPRDGDQEWNQALAKGFELADRAFSENPMNAKSAEERASMVRRHAAVRNRAAGYGPLRADNIKLNTQISDLKKQLAEYRGSEPARSGSAPAARKEEAAGGWVQRLRAKARQG